jgi:XTP/dITP diphosphohydrolase
LERTNKKFIKRFQYLEGKAGELGKPLMDMTLAEMDVFLGRGEASDEKEE